MCDTLCRFDAEAGGTLFAKNSDRSPNEPHLVVRVPAEDHAPGSPVRLTYITIPQAERTLETILCKPSWTWGAEMGVNSASVAIGNEAVFTRAGRGPAALIGMDLVRLALERSRSAEEALSCITSLLSEYGQGGNCGFDHEFHYDNGFIIADPEEGYVLETSGRRWAARRFTDKASISNRLSIRTEHTQRGGVEEGFDFAGRLTEPVFTHFSGSRQRLDSTASALERPLGIEGMMSALRSHYPKDADTVFTKGSVRSVCMHAGGLVGDQTTGSLVAVLRRGGPPTLWCTGASTPCLSAFKPVFFGPDPVPPLFESEEDAKRYWLKREALHRGVLSGMVDLSALRIRRDECERGWIAGERKLFASGIPDDAALSRLSLRASDEEEAMVRDFLPKEPVRMSSRGRFSRYWAKKNSALPLESIL